MLPNIRCSRWFPLLCEGFNIDFFLGDLSSIGMVFYVTSEVVFGIGLWRVFMFGIGSGGMFVFGSMEGNQGRLERDA